MPHCAVMTVSGGGEEAQDGRELQAVASAATKTCSAWWPWLWGEYCSPDVQFYAGYVQIAITLRLWLQWHCSLN